VRTGARREVGSSVLRHLLGQAMQVATCYDGELKTFYKRLASPHSKPIAKKAATIKLLIRIFHHAEKWNQLCRVQKAR
jgi:hypothetical protein